MTDARAAPQTELRSGQALARGPPPASCLQAHQGSDVIHPGGAVALRSLMVLANERFDRGIPLSFFCSCFLVLPIGKEHP
jgi:hypothetical protein